MGALRFFLAATVVGAHIHIFALYPRPNTISRWFFLYGNSGYAVMMFFCISGFLMSLVLSKRYEFSSRGAVAFYRSRFLRIFSLYWPVLILVLVFLDGTLKRFAASPLLDQLSTVFLIGADWRVGFAGSPYALPVPLVQGWTLGAELTFYLMAPFVLRSWSLSLLLALLSGGARAILVAHFGWHPVWTYVFFPTALIFFLLGHFAYRASERLTWLRSKAAGLGGILVAFGILPVFDPGWDSWPFWIAILAFALALPGIAKATVESRVSKVLGDLSYPIYIVHLPLIFALKWFGFFDGSIASRSQDQTYVAVLTMVVAASIFARYAIELPTSRLLRRALGQRGSAEKTDPLPAAQLPG